MVTVILSSDNCRLPFFVNIDWLLNEIEGIFKLFLVGGMIGLYHVNHHE